MVLGCARISVTALTEHGGTCSNRGVVDVYGGRAPVHTGAIFGTMRHQKELQFHNRAYEEWSVARWSEGSLTNDEEVQDGDEERVCVQALVGGDGRSRYETGIMQRGVLYAATRHDAPASEFWPVYVDSGTMRGALVITFALSVHPRWWNGHVIRMEPMKFV